MGLFEQFPYSNFHNLNLDWVLKMLKEYGVVIDGLDEKIKEMIDNGLENLNIVQLILDALSQYGLVINVKAPPNGLSPASGDGTTDDTATIQGCIDYAYSRGGMGICFPSGSYLTQPLIMKDNVSLFGFAKENTRIVMRGGATKPLISGNCSNISIDSLTLDGNMDIQINNMDVVNLTGGKLFLSNLRITDGYNLINLNLTGDCIINNCMLDKAVINGCTVVGSGNLVIDNVVVNELSELSGKYALDLGVDNALVTNLYSNARTYNAINVTGNNCYISAKVINTSIDYTNTGIGNSFDIRGNSSIEDLSYKKEIKANEINLNCVLPLGYKNPVSYNSYFKTIPMRGSEGVYDVLVKGELDIETIIADIKASIQDEIQNRNDAENALSEEIQSEVQTRIDADIEINERITLTNQGLENKIDEEVQNRIDGYAILTQDLNEEITLREQANIALQGSIDSVTTKINDEIEERESLDTEINERITTMDLGINNRLDEEIQNRIDADSELQEQIGGNSLNDMDYATMYGKLVANSVIIKDITGIKKALNRNDGTINIMFIGDSIAQGANNVSNETFVERSAYEFRKYFPMVNIYNYSLGARNSDLFLKDSFIKVSSGEVLTENYTSPWGALGVSWKQNCKDVGADLIFICFGMNEMYGAENCLSSQEFIANIVEMYTYLKTGDNTISFATTMIPTSNAEYYPPGQEYAFSVNDALRLCIKGLTANLLDCGSLFEIMTTGITDSTHAGFADTFEDVNALEDVKDIYSMNFNMPSTYPPVESYANLLIRWRDSYGFGINFYNDGVNGNVIRINYIGSGFSTQVGILTGQGTNVSISFQGEFLIVNGVIIETFYGLVKGKIEFKDALLAVASNINLFYEKPIVCEKHLSEELVLGKLNPGIGNSWTGLGGNGVNHPSPYGHATGYFPPFKKFVDEACMMGIEWQQQNTELMLQVQYLEGLINAPEEA